VANNSARVVMDSSGQGLAVWRANAPSPQEQQYVRGAMYQAGWRSIFSIATGNFGVGGAEVAATPGGQAVVVWSAFSSISPLVADVLAARCALSGSGCGVPTPLENDSAGGWDIDPQVAVNATGTAMAVWLRYDSASSTASLRASRMLAGSWDAAPVFIDALDYRVSASPSVSVDASGNALAVWAQEVEAGTGARIAPFANRFDVASGWGTPQPLEAQSRMDDIYPAQRPQVAFSLTGEALAVWETGGGVISGALFSGGSWGGGRDISNGAGGVSRSPQIVFDSGGIGISVFVENSGFTNTPSVFASRFE
jgi:hypothetical protein